MNPRTLPLAHGERQEKGDNTLHAAGCPRRRLPLALLSLVLRSVAFVYPVGLCHSVLGNAGGHRFDEIVLVHEPKHTFLAGRDRDVTVKPPASSTDTHQRTWERERFAKYSREKQVPSENRFVDIVSSKIPDQREQARGD